LSNKESEEKIILFPDQLDEVADGIQKDIRKMGVYKKVIATETLAVLFN